MTTKMNQVLKFLMDTLVRINPALYELSTKIYPSVHPQTLSGTQPTDFPMQNAGESYRPGGRTPRYLSGGTPKGVPTVSTRSQATSAQPISSEIISLEQRPSDTSGLSSSGETSYTLDFPSENGRFVPAGPVVASRTETIITSIQPNSLQFRKQGSVVGSPSPSLGFEEDHLSHPLSSTSQTQENLHTQSYPSSVGLHLLPSEPLRALVVPSSSLSSLLENNSISRQSSAEVADPEEGQLHAEATTFHLPSLGYLDEALSFIASERARLTAARSTTSISTAGGESSSREQLSRESEGDDDALRQQEGEDWMDAIGRFSPDLPQ